MMPKQDPRTCTPSHAKGGFTLLELMVAIAILSTLVTGLIMAINFISKTQVKSRAQTNAANFSEQFFTRLNNIPYQFVFAMDSSSPSYGMNGTFGPVTNQVAAYPYKTTLDQLKTQMISYSIDRFTLDIVFMIRDTSDILGNGVTGLRPFTDVNGDLKDDYDAGVKFFDQNGDGDYYDTFVSTGDEITEQPDTHLKQATLKLYQAGQMLFQDTRLISWEKLSGAEGKAAGATLVVEITTPSTNSTVYALTTASQTASFNLHISTPYPSEVVISRGDAGSPLHITGNTTPSSIVSWTLKTATNAILDTCGADVLGSFDCTATNVTANLVEGQNKLWGQATKSVYYSPWTYSNIIYDINPPSITSMTPTGIVLTAQPVVSAVIVDTPVVAGNAVSGVNTAVLTLFNGTNTVSFTYDHSAHTVTGIGKLGIWPVLSTGNYTVALEGGDDAYYKVRSSWTFTVNVGTANDFVDNSSPTVSNNSPTGFIASNPPTISVTITDPESGINANSISLAIDGNVVVSSVTGNLMTAYVPNAQSSGGTITYTPPNTLASGVRVMTLKAGHWATNPSNLVNFTYLWGFLVP